MNTFNTVIMGFINGFQTPVFSVIVALLMLYFTWNTFRFIKTNNEDERKERRQSMVYSVITLAVAFSFWGLISVFQSAFNFNSNSNNIHGQVQTLFKK